jgi:hypothetical protein
MAIFRNPEIMSPRFHAAGWVVCGLLIVADGIYWTTSGRLALGCFATLAGASIVFSRWRFGQRLKPLK